MTQYPCLGPGLSTLEKHKCPLVSEYFAKNNKAKYGHICRSHYHSMTDEEKKDYELG